MTKITFVIPYQEVTELVEQTFREDNDGQWELELVLATGVRSIVKREFVTDVAIARGVTAAALKRMLHTTPVVELPVSGYDIMRAAKECQRRFNAKKIAIVGSADMIYGSESIQEIMDIELISAHVKDEDDAEPIIQGLKEQGVTTFIGGVMSTTIAERLGMKAVFIETGRAAIYHALREAKRVSWIRRKEQERAEQFRAIINYSTEGIIAVDAKGVINLANTAAMEITNLRDEAVGRKIDHVLPQLRLEKVLVSGRPELGDIETVNEQQVAVNRVPIVISNETVGAVATFQPVSAIQELEGKIREKIYRRGHVAKLTFDDILGQSDILRRSLLTAREFSRVNSNVLIVGETGTGKEVFAQSIHNASSRYRGPFVAVNCAALPENLLESELFGYAEGAFTGAARGGKIGLFELAHRGTIFLDEISEMSPKLQGRLLRVLQEREIMRLGDGRVIPVDVRIIAASNRDLRKLMEEGGFRQDLYYRLDILKLVLPPLRERPEDIMPLMHHFLKIYSTRANKPLKDISIEAEAALKEYSWPGNVRELRNVAERLTVLTSGGIITQSDMGAALHSGKPKETAVFKPEGDNLNQDVLLKVLAESHYHYGKAAAMLGISRTTLWRRLKQERRTN